MLEKLPNVPVFHSVEFESIRKNMFYLKSKLGNDF